MRTDNIQFLYLPQFGYYMILLRKCGALLFLFYFIYVHVFIFLRNLNVS